MLVWSSPLAWWSSALVALFCIVSFFLSCFNFRLIFVRNLFLICTWIRSFGVELRCSLLLHCLLLVRVVLWCEAYELSFCCCLIHVGSCSLLLVGAIRFTFYRSVWLLCVILLNFYTRPPIHCHRQCLSWQAKIYSSTIHANFSFIIDSDFLTNDIRVKLDLDDLNALETMADLLVFWFIRGGVMLLRCSTFLFVKV